MAVDPASPLYVVINESSGSHGTTSAREIIEDVLEEAGREHHFCIVEEGSRLPQIARETVERARVSGGVVVVAGGDGTLNTVVQAALGSGCPLGVVPQGTFNYFSRTHDIPADTAEATRLLLSARAHPVQVGLVNDRVFLVNASLGLYPQVIEDREAYKKQFGRTRLVALAAAAVTLLREHRQLRLHVEDCGQTQRIRTPTLIVANNRQQLEDLGFAEASLLDGGRLAAIIVRPVGTLAMAWLLLRGAIGQLGEADNITSFAFKRIVVTPAMPYGTKRVRIAVDGETGWLRSPLEFRISPEPLYLLKPEPASVPAS